MKKWGPGGRADFHALRHTFITMLHAAGATFEEVRLLARHAPRGLTDKTYLHVRPERLHELAEAVGRMVLPEAAAGAEGVRMGTDNAPITAEPGEIHAPSMNGAGVRSATASAMTSTSKGLETVRNEQPTGVQIPPCPPFQRNRKHQSSREKPAIYL
jgi:hypothetical protein